MSVRRSSAGAQQPQSQQASRLQEVLRAGQQARLFAPPQQQNDAQIRAMQDQLRDEYNAKEAQLSAKLEDLEAQVAQLEKQLNTASETIRSKNVAIERTQAKAGNLRARLDRIQKETDDCAKQQAELQNKLKKTSDELSAKHRAWMNAQIESGKLREEAKDCASKQKAHDDQIRQLKDAMTDLTKRVRDDDQAKIDKLSARNAQLNRRLNELSESNAQWMFEGVWGGDDGQESPVSSSDTVSPHTYTYKEGDEVWYKPSNVSNFMQFRATITRVGPMEQLPDNSWANLDYEIRLPSGSYKQTTWEKLRPM